MRITTPLIIIAANAFVAGGSTFEVIISIATGVALAPALPLLAIIFGSLTAFWIYRTAKQINDAMDVEA